MKILNIENIKENNQEVAIALGNFDGVHKGHEALINFLIEIAREKNQEAALLLFKNHTRNLTQEKKVKLLTSNEEKVRIFAGLGLDILYQALFNEELRNLSAEDFVKKILIDKLNIKTIVVGFDYRFGYRAEGDLDLLKYLGKKYDFQVYVIEAQYYREEIISSTSIKRYLNLGNISTASKMLARDYSIEVYLESEEKVESDYLYILANYSEDIFLPKNGIYLCKYKIENKSYLAISRLDDKREIESWLINKDKISSASKAELIFLEYLRDINKEDNKDVEVEKILKELKKTSL